MSSTDTKPEWNPRGSEWNRWDPHIHAPGTINADKFGGDWDGYVKAVNATTPAIRALGVTDYYTLNSYRAVRKLWAAGKLPEVGFVFPNIEVRLDVKTAKAKGINLHFIFSPDDPKHETQIERILGQLTFEFLSETHQCNRAGLINLGRATDAKLIDDDAAFAAGVQAFKVDFNQLRNLFRREGWLQKNCLVAIAAAQGDGTGGLQGDDSFKPLREEMERFAHIVFSGKPCDREFWLGQNPSFPADIIEKKYFGLKPCLHGCDAHEIARVGVPDEKRYCWIKGDLGFETLRQVVIEPEGRVWIGEQPPLAAAPSSVLDTIRPIAMPWLINTSVPLNGGLTAIIGARGSGKTALADMIAAGADALVPPLAESSFLKRATKDADLIGPAKVEEIWRDKTKHTGDFRPPGEFDFDGPPPAVHYLSQQFVDRLCSSSGLARELRSEIERVIFEHTDPTNRFGATTFVAMADGQLEPVRYRRDQHSESVTSFSTKAADEQRLIEQTPKLTEDRDKLEETLKRQRTDLEALLPKGNEERSQRLLAIDNACTAAEEKVEAVRKQLNDLANLLADAHHERDFAEPERFADMQERFAGAGLKPEQWSAFRMKFAGDPDAVVTAARAAALKEEKLILDGDPAKAVDVEKDAPSLWPLTTLRKEREALRKVVGVDTDRQKKYAALKKTITSNEAALKKANAAITHAQGANERRNGHYLSRKNAYKQVFATFEEEEKLLASLYEPLHEELKGATGSLARLRFAVRREIDFDSWIAAGEQLLDLRKESLFRGHGRLAEEARKDLLKAWKSGTAEAVAAAMQEFATRTYPELRKAMPGTVPPEGRAEWFRSLGDWLYSTGHVSIRYGLEYDNTDVEHLSPGTRGIVLLLLYLAIDRNDRRPLLIDQPEENLDPKSVFHDLVPHFREARTRRQVIIVTHNANLVVNTDADQVIVANAHPASDGGLPTITYDMGSLENPAIRHAVCDILEGGKRAFLERERRYRIQWDQMLADDNEQNTAKP